MLDAQKISIGGALIHVSSGGTGPAVVLVHGLGVSGTYLLPVARVLARRFTVYVPDLPGFGRSESPRRALGVGGLTDALAACLDALGLGPTGLLANSLCCQVVTELAVRAPERVGALTLVGPTVDPYLRSARRQAALIALDTLREPPSLVPIIAQDYARFGPLRLAATARAALRDRIEERLPRIDVPAVVVRGERDAFVSQRWCEEAAALLPNGRLSVVAGAAHAAHYSHPDEVAALVPSDPDGGDGGVHLHHY
jgi:pimeloyl-ACP methyl ester carboxylesterase